MVTQEEQLRTVLKNTVLPTIGEFLEGGMNEEDTKSSLIDPILGALGWNIHNMKEVNHEFRPSSGDNPVDYALKIDQKPRLFLEAKGLGEDLSNHKWVKQTLTYSYSARVKWCILTDGNDWRLYNGLAAEMPDEEKLFARTRLTEDGPNAVATLSLLSRSSIEGNQLEVFWASHLVRLTLQRMLEVRDDQLLQLVADRCNPKLKAEDVAHAVSNATARLKVVVEMVSPTVSAPLPLTKTPANMSAGNRFIDTPGDRSFSLVDGDADEIRQADIGDQTHGEGGFTSAQLFRDAFPKKGATADKRELLDALIANGAKPTSAGAYVCWAKRDPKVCNNPARQGNPFGFQITETKDAAGRKILTRI